MNIKDYYLANNSIPNWWEKYNTTGRNRMFYFIKSTNFRLLTDFISIFNNFKKIEGLDRNKWPLNKQGQDKNKQHTVNMKVTKLFELIEGKYYRTEKGKLYDQFTVDTSFTENEKWILNYLFLLDSYVNNEKNYFIYRSSEIVNGLANVLGIDVVKTYLMDFLLNYCSQGEKIDIFKESFFYLHSLYDEYDFLDLYDNSTTEEKEELYEYISNNYFSYLNCLSECKNKDYKFCDAKIPKDALSKKYTPINNRQGQYTIKMLLDDAKILYVSLSIIENLNNGREKILLSTLEMYNSLFSIDIDKIKKYVNNNKCIFDPILENLYEYSDEGEDVESVNEINVKTSSIEEYDRPYDKVDDTSIEGQEINKGLFSKGKVVAKKLSNYNCALDSFYNCNDHYFTSKYTGQNYMEVHHFLPREFRNNFGKSIEVQANYIVLCPRCHKMIHNAVDNERKPMITGIFNQRIERLKKCGLEIELKEILKLYHLDREIADNSSEVD